MYADFPADYGDAVAEYSAFETDAVIVAGWGPRTLLKLTGDDRHKWLHNFCTNDIKKLEPGHGCEAFFTNVKARILGHGYVFATDDALWIETVGGQEEKLFQHLDRYIITEDVEIHRLSESHTQLLLAGPEAAKRLKSFCDQDVSSLSVLQNVAAKIGAVDVGIRKLNLSTADDNNHWLVLNVLATDRDTIFEQLTDGANRFTPVGSCAFEARRIESVVPYYGVDLTEDHMAPEAGRNQQAICYTKGCYLGQEPIARLDAMGHTNKELRAIAFENDPGLNPGDTLKTADDANAGVVTSVANRPGGNAVVALAVLKRAFMESGAEVANGRVI